MIALWLIPILIGYIITIYLIKTGQKEIRRQKRVKISDKEIVEILDYKITDIAQNTKNQFGKEIKLSKELLKSYLSNSIKS